MVWPEGAGLELGPITIEDWRQVIRTIEDWKARGWDGLSVAEAKALPEECLDWLLRIFWLIEFGGAEWPTAWVRMPVVILTKGEGETAKDTRPIGIESLPPKMWSMI